MKKIPTIFKRDISDMRRVTSEPHPDCGWVFKGEGVATRKYDGTCCLVSGGELWKRRNLGKGRPPPEGFKFAAYDVVTGKTIGWVPVEDNNADKWHLEAFVNGNWPDGTYELCGPRIQGNQENFKRHVLVPHATATQYYHVERTFEGIRTFLDGMDIEGLVFHHPDGRKAKIKKRDYGLVR